MSSTRSECSRKPTPRPPAGRSASTRWVRTESAIWSLNGRTERSGIECARSAVLLGGRGRQVWISSERSVCWRRAMQR